MTIKANIQLHTRSIFKWQLVGIFIRKYILREGLYLEIIISEYVGPHARTPSRELILLLILFDIFKMI